VQSGGGWGTAEHLMQIPGDLPTTSSRGGSFYEGSNHSSTSLPQVNDRRYIPYSLNDFGEALPPPSTQLGINIARSTSSHMGESLGIRPPDLPEFHSLNPLGVGSTACGPTGSRSSQKYSTRTRQTYHGSNPIPKLNSRVANAGPSSTNSYIEDAKDGARVAFWRQRKDGGNAVYGICRGKIIAQGYETPYNQVLDEHIAAIIDEAINNFLATNHHTPGQYDYHHHITYDTHLLIT
jgi:hypothetical protein